MALLRRTAVLSAAALLSGLVASTAAGAGPVPGGGPSAAAAAGAARLGPGPAGPGLDALVEPEAELPGPLPADPRAALETAVTASAARFGLDLHPAAAIGAARLAPALEGRLAL